MSTFVNILSTPVINSSGVSVHLSCDQVNALIAAGLTQAIYDADISPSKIANLIDIFDLTGMPLTDVSKTLVAMLKDKTNIMWVLTPNKIQVITLNVRITPTLFIPTVATFWNTLLNL
jgi:hypothetical protein